MLLLDFVVDLSKKLHKPLRKLEKLIIVAILRYFKGKQELEDQPSIMKNVNTLFKG